METRLLALGGATGSGKTALAIKLSQQYPQLVILSGDSRQVYKKLDIGTAKVGKPDTDHTLTNKAEPVWRVDGVAQYLIDIAEPNTTFTLSDYQKEAYRLIAACWQKGKVPFLVGGTGLYIQAVTEGYILEGKPNARLREKLEAMPVETLQDRLTALGGTIPESDRANKRRLIRAIERVQVGGEMTTKRRPLTRNVHTFVLERPWNEQRDLAPTMVQERLDLGLVKETKQLLKEGVDKEWLKSMGLSYRLVINMLDGAFPESELAERMIHEFRQLMRRQRTWFNRMPYARKMPEDKIGKAMAKILVS